METMILLGQTCLVGYLAAWLFLGVRDNVLHPTMNGAFTAEVLGLDRLREGFPEAYARIAHRRVTDPVLRRLAFRFIVACEVLVCALLWVGTAWMALALVGAADPQAARPVALAGALGFTSLWAGFLIVGNHFAYWFCHEWAQNTHFQMVLWGIGTMVFLVLGQGG